MKGYIKHTFNTREEWLKNRVKGIGGSEAAAVLGLSKWAIKTGKKEPEDIAGKDYVQYGIKAEPLIRGLFALDNPQYEVIYDEFNSYQNAEYPFLLASVDGILKEKETGR
ncbi:YqaJ viral recombinase family protein, partial [Candidatus Proelusimicrobium excrementi]|uniref:YqaJ viral recombinase family protein n=1 Tax=Candidatus Proelusimicrobium excrementi TaxID=3416222 RepID=UPI003D0CF5F6